MSVVRDKLVNNVLPRILSARQYHRWRRGRVYEAYFWCGEIFVLLVGLGVSHPAMRLLAPSAGTGNKGNLPIIETLGEGILFLIAVLGLLGWGILKTFVAQEALNTKYALMQNAKLEMDAIYISLEEVLELPTPMTGLNEVSAKCREIVRRLSAAGALPFPLGVAPDISIEVTREADALCQRYSARWRENPSSEIQTRE